MSDVRLPKAGSIEISPSILSADFASLGSEIAEVEAAGVKLVHLDVMDGHFVPNITIGPPVVAHLRRCCKLVFDTHLMITDPRKYAKRFVDAGSDHITFHVETVDDAADMIAYLHDLGVTAGVSLNPETPVATIEAVAPLCDMILVMTVHPGFGGQTYIDAAARKCIRLRELVGPDVRIEVDGGINPDTVARVVGYGADTIVAGNAIFGENDRAAAITALRAGTGR
ncbi:MAG: ribulose-phosphate 3-epimerase [Phycisphaerae bacterium]|nr:ribulose-phosphate 3-epimerase [Phycisphaerae bacterium]